MDLTKPIRQQNRRYLAHVRDQGCCIGGSSCAGGDEAHHLAARGGRGSEPLIGGSDYTAVCLCRAHHSEVHSCGLPMFEQRYGVNLWKQVARVLISYLSSEGVLPLEAGRE